MLPNVNNNGIRPGSVENGGGHHGKSGILPATPSSNPSLAGSAKGEFKNSFMSQSHYSLETNGNKKTVAAKDKPSTVILKPFRLFLDLISINSFRMIKMKTLAFRYSK